MILKLIVKNKLAIPLILFFILFSIGCTNVNQPDIVQQPSQTVFAFIPESPEYSCFKITGVSETYGSTGYFGKNIADNRRVTGTIENNCGKIMEVYLAVQWFDEKGQAAYSDQNLNFFRLKSGESRKFQADGYHTDIRRYGYLEETKGWSYKIGLGSHTQTILSKLTNSGR